MGKSSLLSTLTNTESEAAAYEFTTLTCIPGNIIYNDTKIQLLDLPGTYVATWLTCHFCFSGARTYAWWH